MKPINFKRTLDNPQWLANNAPALRSIFPHGWTCICTINTNASFMCDRLKPLGIKLTHYEHVADVIAKLIELDVLEFIPSAQGDLHEHGYFRVKPHGMDVDVELSITA